jgi:hypothetical protein
MEAPIGIVLVMNGAVASSFRWRVAGICMQREELPQVMSGLWCSRHLEREQATEDESLVQKSLAQIPKGRSSLEASASPVEGTSTQAGARRP